MRYFFILMIALDKRNNLRYILKYMLLWWCYLKFRLSNLQYFACIQLFYILFNINTIHDGIMIKLGIFVIYITYNMILKIHTDFSDCFWDLMTIWKYGLHAKYFKSHNHIFKLSYLKIYLKNVSLFKGYHEEEKSTHSFKLLCNYEELYLWRFNGGLYSSLYFHDY